MLNLLIKLFIKDKGSINNFKVRESYGKLAGITGIATNSLLFLLKITAGLFFHSIAIIADAINNLSDSGSSVVTLAGFKISGKPADAEHPYGHRRMEYIAGLTVSLIILALGIELIKSSAEKIIHPQNTQFSVISLAVLVVSVLIKIWQSLFYRKIGKIINSVTLLATSIDSRNDVAATSAILLALIVTKLTGFDLDGYMGIAVALFIMASGVKLVIETINPLLGTAPTRELVDKIYNKIISYDYVIGLHDLTVHSYGAGKCFASVHCEVPAEHDILISHDVIDNIERDFLKDDGIHMVIHLDPVVTGDEKTNNLKAEVEKLIRSISPEISMHDFRVVWGISHSNLIFDVVSPFDSRWSDEELINLISNKITEINKTCNSVITVDHSYIPDNGD